MPPGPYAKLLPCRIRPFQGPSVTSPTALAPNRYTSHSLVRALYHASIFSRLAASSPFLHTHAQGEKIAAAPMAARLWVR